MKNKNHIQFPIFKKLKVITSILVMCVQLIIFTFIAPIFILNEYWKLEYFQLMVFFCQLIITFTGVWIAGDIQNISDLIESVMVAGLWFVLVLCAGIVAFNGITNYVKVSLAACTIGAGSVIAIKIYCYNRKKSIRIKHKRR